MIENHEQFMPVMANIPTGDIIGVFVVVAAIATVAGMIIKGNREVKRLRNQGYSGDEIPRILQLRHRDRRERGNRTNDTLRNLH